MPPAQALGTRQNMRVGDTGPELGLRYDRTKSTEKMALSDTPVASQSESGSMLSLEVRYSVQPFCHQIRRKIGKMVSAERSSRVNLKVDQAKERTNVDDVFYFVLNIFHFD